MLGTQKSFVWFVVDEMSNGEIYCTKIEVC